MGRINQLPGSQFQVLEASSKKGLVYWNFYRLSLNYLIYHGHVSL